MSIEDFNAEMHELQLEHDKQLQDLRARRSAWIASMWPKWKLGYFATGKWEWKCEQSPIDICIYDTKEDYLHDECVFCGKPEERK